MRKIILGLCAFFLVTISVNSQTEGDLNVSVATSEAGGPYAPRHVLAIWVEDDAGNFVKSLMVYANYQMDFLTNWKSSTSAAGQSENTTDAITGATKNSHATRTCSWDGTNYNGTLVADGTYKVCMELTDRNNTGNYAEFEFSKTESSETLNPANQNSFSSVSLQWNAVSAIGDEIENQFEIYPNPVSEKLNLSGDFKGQEYTLSIYNQNGCLISEHSGRDNELSIDTNDYASGVYYIRINCENGQAYVNRFVKK